MGLYTKYNAQESADIVKDVNFDELMEAFFYDEHYSDSDAEKQALFEQMESINEANKISRKTLVRLNKNDDLSRRTSMAALELAKQNNDVLWKKLVKNRVQERKLRAAIFKKYGNKAKIVATKGQREYVTGSHQSGSNSVHTMTKKEMSNTRN